MGPQPPARILIRSYADMALRFGHAERAPFDGDPLSTFIFKTLAGANRQHLPYASAESRLLAQIGEPAAAAMDERRALMRPVSIHAVSQSLKLPYETVRARVQTMLDRGQMERVRGGLIAVAALAPDGPFAEAVLNSHAVIVESFQALSLLGYDFAASAAPSQVDEPPPPGLIVRIVMDMSARYTELLSPTFGGILPITIWAGVMRANVRELMTDPEAAWRYAGQDEPPPDALRRPISVRALSNELNLPFETTRRHVASMADRGWLTSIPGQGVIGSTAVITNPGLGRVHPDIPGLYGRALTNLWRVGFDFEAI